MAGQYVRYIGKLDIELFRCIAEDITTDEVIITEERIAHIAGHHPGHFEVIGPFLQCAVSEPDYILEDRSPHSALLLKRISTAQLNIQVVLRLHTSGDTPGFKNSVISAWKIREKEYRRLVHSRKILYKRE